MEAILDKFGRLLIPKEIRKALGIHGGSRLLLQLTMEGTLEVAPVPEEALLEKEGTLLVYHGKMEEGLRADTISKTLEEIREERTEKLSSW